MQSSDITNILQQIATVNVSTSYVC